MTALNAQVHLERTCCTIGGPFFQVAVWTNRVLSLISIVFCILDFTVGITILFGICFAILTIFGLLSPLTLSCRCCVRKSTGGTNTDETCGRIKIYIWLFLSNLAYVGILTLTCYTGVPTTHYRDTWLGKLYFAVLIICPFLFSICNMYTICLVSKFGFCFVEGMQADMNNGLQNNDLHALQVVTSNARQYPINLTDGMMYRQFGQAYIDGGPILCPPYSVTNPHLEPLQTTPQMTPTNSSFAHTEQVVLPPIYSN